MCVPWKKNEASKSGWKIFTILMLIICCCLSGCGNKEEVVAEKILDEAIKEAIRKELDTNYDYIRDFSYEITRERRKGKSYTLDLAIQAVGKYAIFSIDGTINFVNDGNEWLDEGGTLNKTSYTITDYPDADYLYQIVLSSISDNKDNCSLLSFEPKNNVVEIRVSTKKDHYLYSYTYDFTKNFEYEPTYEKWTLDRLEYNKSIHDPILIDIAGDYYLEPQNFLVSEGPLRIYDCQNDRFSVEYPSISEPLVFVFNSSGEYIAEIDEKYYKRVFIEKVEENTYKMFFIRGNKEKLVPFKEDYEGSIIIKK